jgi:hypothetical protein
MPSAKLVAVGEWLCDDEHIVLHMRMSDGSMRACHWMIADLIKHSREIAPRRTAPSHSEQEPMFESLEGLATYAGWSPQQLAKVRRDMEATDPLTGSADTSDWLHDAANDKPRRSGVHVVRWLLLLAARESKSGE